MCSTRSARPDGSWRRPARRATATITRATVSRSRLRGLVQSRAARTRTICRRLIDLLFSAPIEARAPVGDFGFERYCSTESLKKLGSGRSWPVSRCWQGSRGAASLSTQFRKVKAALSAGDRVVHTANRVVCEMGDWLRVARQAFIPPGLGRASEGPRLASCGPSPSLTLGWGSSTQMGRRTCDNQGPQQRVNNSLRVYSRRGD